MMLEIRKCQWTKIIDDYQYQLPSASMPGNFHNFPQKRGKNFQIMEKQERRTTRIKLTPTTEKRQE